MTTAITRCEYPRGFCTTCWGRQNNTAASQFHADQDVTVFSNGRCESGTVIAPRTDGSGLVDVQVARGAFGFKYYALTPMVVRTADRVVPALGSGR